MILHALAGRARRFDELWRRAGWSLWPPRCLVCAEPGRDGRDLCGACCAAWPRAGSACVRCAMPLPVVRRRTMEIRRGREPAPSVREFCRWSLQPNGAMTRISHGLRVRHRSMAMHRGRIVASIRMPVPGPTGSRATPLHCAAPACAGRRRWIASAPPVFTAHRSIACCRVSSSIAIWPPGDCSPR
ncbi:double zinc ribbon domain-containing protein [Lysobacter capsici]|uniref:double zinc ribbon domain-containing protein n=1 Tax=Lysobacter capsici TaxID=435897 RepID=UPI00398D3AAD